MKKLSFSLLAFIIIVLAIATFVEKYCGTVFVNEHIYGTWWFIVVWGMLAVSCFIYMLSRKLQKNLSTFLLHLSFLIILTGALLTALTAKHGSVHLRMNEPVRSFVGDNRETIDMPFTLTLDTFLVSYYPGTNAPADYTSRFTVSSGSTDTFAEQVSMNHIFSYRGLRLYQASYDSDNRGSILSVNYDRWGVPVTYAGYFMLFMAMAWNLFSRKGYFRRMLGSPLLKKGVFCMALFFIGTVANATERTMSETDAGYMGEVQVLYNGRIAPLQTLAYDFTLKLTGKTSFRDYTPEQVFLGWLLFPSSWEDIPMIRVKDTGLRKALGFSEEHMSLKDFFSPQHEYLLEPHLNAEAGKLKKAALEADEKIQLLRMLNGGELFKVFPVTVNDHTVWYASTSTLPMELDDNQWLFIKKGLGLLGESVFKNDVEGIHRFISKLMVYQQKNGGNSILPACKVKAERLYNRVPFSTLLYRINLLIGLLLLCYFCFCMIRQQNVSKRLLGLFVALLWFSFLFLTVCLALRGYISGRLPMSNGYETMMTLAWCILLITILCYRRFRFILSFGFLLSGFCLLVASLGQMNPQITPLMPVLSSPLLSLHVSLIMMSYALFSFIFLSGVLALVLSVRQGDESMKMLQAFSRLLLVPALFLLGAGIFIGAIWANVSWGRYWGWDPKEVWALISFLVYAFALHCDSLSYFRKPLFFHVFMILAFFTILMTYFGVNYFLGGMHSYANS